MEKYMDNQSLAQSQYLPLAGSSKSNSHMGQLEEERVHRSFGLPALSQL
jgi:hypothetical protein